MARPTTIEEAAERQDALWDDHQGMGEWQLRSASLKDGYEMRFVYEHGTGRFPVNIETGEVCEFEGVWLLDGKVLLCKHCWEDGT